MNGEMNVERKETGQTEMMVFENDQFGKVRTINKDGEPWFVGRDL